MLPSHGDRTEQTVPVVRLVSGGFRLNNVARAQHGDREAFEELVREFTPATYRVARAIVGEGAAPDVVQDVFVSAWRELPKLREPERFPAWLHRIVLNRSRSTLRRQTRVREVDLALIGDAVPAVDVRSDIEARAVLMPVLLALPFDQRSVVALHYAGGLTLAETARILGVPDGTVKSRLNAALATLRRALSEVSDG